MLEAAKLSELDYGFSWAGKGRGADPHSASTSPFPRLGVCRVAVP